MKMRLSAAAVVLTVSVGLAGMALAAPDFGDCKSETLTTRAWKALDSQSLDDGLAYAGRCVELYEAEAKKMQASLKDYPANQPREETSKYWALNDVGTCYFIQGEILLKKGDKKGAKEAYSKVINDFRFAQCWDTKGWFWKPVDAAKKKLVELEFDEK